MPRYEGFYVVRTVNRWIFGSGAKGKGALMPSELVTKGFWVRITRYEGFHAVMTVNRWVLGSGTQGTGAHVLS